MFSHDIEPGWTVEWATPSPNGDEYLDNLVLSRDQAIEYGDELVMSLRVDGRMLRERELDPREPFIWKIEDGKLLTEQISRRIFEEVANSDRDDALYAQHVLVSRAEKRLNRPQ
ncbi:hypothetical protein [Natronomonas gomsonensis]|uniref:hypothetical protein n=1 Tax=Natronomonas gomsonensis TaxID=1046043 RepID=UPI0015BFB1DC|nr:hypothetical protein [Natronomonas gomsonensis]